MHFFAFAPLFGLRRFVVLAVVLTLLGVVAMLLGVTGWPAAVPLVAGVAPGLVLLGFGVWAACLDRGAAGRHPR